jgi:hypothetical protein
LHIAPYFDSSFENKNGKVLLIAGLSDIPMYMYFNKWIFNFLFQNKDRPHDPDNLPAGSMDSLLMISSDMINVVGATDNLINELWTDAVCGGD